MNIPNYRTRKIGKLLISRINNETTFLFKGKKKIYAKTYYHRGVFSKLTKAVGVILFLTLIVSSIYYISTGINRNSNQPEIVQENTTQDSEENDADILSNSPDNDIDKDEKAKNELLLSEKTDYTEAKEESLQIREYTVKPGDTLSEIAKEFGVSMDTICGSNNLYSYDYIRQGVTYRIPNKDGILHKVKKGDTVAKIAEKWGGSVEKIISENSIKNFDFITPNDLIFVPDAKPQNIIPGFMWPTPSRRITSRFGMRRHPIYKRRMFHQGIDIRCNYKSIKATKFGRVTHTGWMGRYGNAVIIAHPGGWKSLYGHLSKIYVKTGQQVKQGQYIGRSGDTGDSTGPHLHFELMRNGRHVDPYPYLHYK